MNRNNQKVVEFAQTLSRTKIFRHHHPIPEQLKIMLLIDIYPDFTQYAESHYFQEAKLFIDEFLIFHPITGHKKFSLEQNLLWWFLLQHNVYNKEMNVIDRYIFERKYKYSKKQIIPAWLKEWERAVPKFYYVKKTYHQSVFTLIDILEKNEFKVAVYDPNAITPKEGEIVAGTLIPIGNSVYFPVVDFYHFLFDVSAEIVTYIFYYYDYYLDNDKTISDHEIFLHLLSIALQIESKYNKGERAGDSVLSTC